MLGKKYELLEAGTNFTNPKLRRIRALVNFGNVMAGDIGGWVESEDNLSQEDKCWVFDNSRVTGNAVVRGHALVLDDSLVCDGAIVCDRVIVKGHSVVCGDSRLSGDSEVLNYSVVGDRASVLGKAKLDGHVAVSGGSVISGSAYVSGEIEISGFTTLSGDAIVLKASDYCVFRNTWSGDFYFTYTKSNKMWLVGDFYGTSDELLEYAYAEGDLSVRCYSSYIRLVEELEGIDYDFQV